MGETDSTRVDVTASVAPVPAAQTLVSELRSSLLLFGLALGSTVGAVGVTQLALRFLR
jgi:hypothetical protein